MSSTYALYIKPTCPYCRKVTNFMAEQGIDVPLVDISTDSAARAMLIETGGKAQVPCLFIDGSPMYESDDIIDYMKSALLKG